MPRPVLIVLACLAVYANSLFVPFLFDDLDAIRDNPRIRSLWPPWETVAAPGMGDITTAGRPVAAYSFALNYALTGSNVWSYHVINVAIHVSAALLLYGIVRRTIRATDPPPRPTSRRLSPENLALLAALLWAVHPLHTESVTYIVQRVESLVGMLVLLILYCVIRGIEASVRARLWYAGAVAACGIAMGVKEVAAVAPLLVLLGDRAFFSGTFRAALRQRSGLYIGLASTWLVLAAVLWFSPRRDMAAQAAAAFGSLNYLRIQCWALIRYLQLAFWPAGLTFDYGGPLHGAQFASTWVEVLPHAVAILLLLVATLVLLRLRPRLGFLGAWLFVLLAPSSSIVPIPLETVAEHRMYLPLAALVILTVLAVAAVVPRPQIAAGILLAAVAALGLVTVQRNQVYRDAHTLWSDTVAKRPDNARARLCLANTLVEQSRLEDALAELQIAVRLAPSYGEAGQNLGAVLYRVGRIGEAEQTWRETIEIEPRALLAYVNLASVLLGRGQVEEAAAVCRSALQVEETYGEARLVLARALLRMGDAAAALVELDRAAGENPYDPRVHNQRGRALLALNRAPEAVAAFRRALEIQPDLQPAIENLAEAQAAAGRRD